MPFFPSLPDGAIVPDVQKLSPDPSLFGHWRRFSEILMRGPSPFTEGQRELIAAYTSGVNSCAWCYGGHSAAAAAFGIPENVFETLMDDLDAAAVEDKMKPVLRFVRKLTESPSRMTQSDADAVFAAGWDETALHQAVLICARFNFMNRFVDGHGLDYTEEAARTNKARIPFLYGAPRAKTDESAAD